MLDDCLVEVTGLSIYRGLFNRVRDLLGVVFGVDVGFSDFGDFPEQKSNENLSNGKKEVFDGVQLDDFRVIQL